LAAFGGLEEEGEVDGAGEFWAIAVLSEDLVEGLISVGYPFQRGWLHGGGEPTPVGIFADVQVYGGLFEEAGWDGDRVGSGTHGVVRDEEDAVVSDVTQMQGPTIFESMG